MFKPDAILEVPAYGTSEVAHYVRLPRRTLEYWVIGSERVPPLIKAASLRPTRLSFMNLLECHVLGAMRAQSLRLPKVRKALTTLHRQFPSAHPLIDQAFETDGVDLFIRHLPHELINISRGGQLAFREILDAHLNRIERAEPGFINFYPFVIKKSIDEPKFILINPSISFGRPVIAGTAISTSIISSRFNARESIGDLAREYALPEHEVEEAIRWEARAAAA